MRAHKAQRAETRSVRPPYIETLTSISDKTGTSDIAHGV
jgi:hypothetical protein